MVNARTALLLVDYQVALCEEGEYTRLPPLAAQVRERNVIATAERVLKAARAAGVYVIHVRLAFEPSYEVRSNRTPRWDSYPAERAMLVDAPGAQIVAPLTPLESEPIVVKASVDPFIGTSLLNMFLGNGIRNVAIAGVATNLAVESAVRHGADSGLQVTVIEDACASFSQAAHEFAVGTIFPMLSTVTSADAYIDSL